MRNSYLNVSVGTASLILCACFEYAVGATRIATTCSAADVQNAINVSVDGDTVVIPSGSCTWSTSVLLNKSVTLKGSGSQVTTINAAVSETIKVSLGNQKSFVISDIGFTGGTGDSIIAVYGSMQNWRIYNLYFATDGGATRLILTRGSTYGVIDHNKVSGGTPSEFVTVDDSDWTSWSRPLVFEDANAVYIEDNQVAWTKSWEGRPVLDSERGGRAVFRYNQVTNSVVINHGFDSGAVSSALQTDVYNNSFTITDSMSTWARLALVRGGTGVWFNNTFTVGKNVWLTNAHIELSVFRNQTDFISTGHSAWPICDGTQYRMCGVDKFWNATASFPTACLSGGSMLCSASKAKLCSLNSDCPTGETCSGFIDGPASSSGYPCFMQPGFGANMKSTPIYAWNNTFTGSQLGSGTVTIAGDAFTIAGRDYFNGVSNPNFKAFTYPHPLVSGNSPAPTSSPTPVPSPTSAPVDTTQPTTTIMSPTDGSIVPLE